MTTPPPKSRPVVAIIFYALYAVGWMVFIGIVNTQAKTPPPIPQSLLAWLLAITGATLPLINFLNSPPEARGGLAVAACALAALGWAGLILLFNFAPFNPGTLWLIFAAWLTALTGTAIPFARYLNQRFSKAVPPDSVLLRQSIWVGIFGATCAWLQLGRALNWAAALLLAAALAAIEGFLILRDRSRRSFLDDSATPPKR